MSFESLIEVWPVGRDFAMYVMPQDRLRYSDPYEQFTADLISRVSRRAGLFIDVGAHYGFFSLLAASSNRSMDVIAIEPAPEAFAVLERNVAKLTRSKVTIDRTAISDSVGTMTFGISRQSENCGFYFHPEAEPVQWIDVATDTLDRLLISRETCPLLVKISAKGHELSVLKGMSLTLQRFKDTTLIVEFSPVALQLAGVESECLLEELDRLGFEIFLVDDSARRTVRLRASKRWEMFFDGVRSANLYCVKRDRALSVCFFSHTRSIIGGAERTLVGLVDELVSDHGALCCVVVPGRGPLVGALESVGASCLISQYQWWCTGESEHLTEEDVARRLEMGIETVFSDIGPQIRVIDPDCIWTMTSVIPWGAMTAGMLGKPHVWSVHEYGEQDHGLKFFWSMERIAADILASSALVYTVSKALAAALFPAAPPDRLRSFVYSISVPPENAGDHRPDFFKDGQSIKLGVFGRVHPSKGQEDAVLAMAELVARGYNVELLIAGAADPTYWETLVALATKTNVAERIHFSGFLADPYPAMRSCDIILICSRNEGFGRVAVEAMLMEKMVVYAAAGGLLETMIDGKTGISYPPADVERLAAALEEVINNPQRRKSIGEFSHNYAAARFGRGASGGEVFHSLRKLRSLEIKNNLVPSLLAETAFNTVADALKSRKGALRTSLESAQYGELRKLENSWLSRVSGPFAVAAQSFSAVSLYLQVMRRAARANPNHFLGFLFSLNRVKRSGLFDRRYYCAKYNETERLAFLHFLRSGARKLRKPHPLFDISYYLEESGLPQARAHEVLTHYLTSGRNRGLRPNALFDPAFYESASKQGDGSSVDPLLHYYTMGWLEGRDPSSEFSTSTYLRLNPDIVASGMNPLEHYLEYGQFEGRRYSETRSNAPVRRTNARDSFVPQMLGSGISPKPIELPKRVSIIIPIYRGVDETRKCIESVLRSRNKTNIRVILVEDQSPEPEVRDLVRQFAEDPRITAHHNAKNLGFSGSINLGAQTADCDDLIILNSDTEVPDSDWVDRLARHVYDDEHVATVTPLSNNATICSYPVYPAGAELRDSFSLNEIDRAAALANVAAACRIPTSVGFCTYIRREAWNRFGPFDAAAFPRGYGEENDFSLKAEKGGWSNLQAFDVFVYHKGEVSFGSSNQELKRAGAKIISSRYPSYNESVAKHVQLDPAYPARVALIAALYKRCSQPVILHVCHDFGGGTEQHILALADQMSEARHLVMRSSPSGDFELVGTTHQSWLRATFSPFQMHSSAVGNLLTSCGVTHVHIHSTINWDEEVLRGLIRSLRLPFNFTVHDYFTICPQIFLCDALGVYCGEPGEAACNTCLRERPREGAFDIRYWRATKNWLFAEAQHVICPSADVARRMKKYHPEAHFIVVPHETVSLSLQKQTG